MLLFTLFACNISSRDQHSEALTFVNDASCVFMFMKTRVKLLWCSGMSGSSSYLAEWRMLQRSRSTLVIMNRLRGQFAPCTAQLFVIVGSSIGCRLKTFVGTYTVCPFGLWIRPHGTGGQRKDYRRVTKFLIGAFLKKPRDRAARCELCIKSEQHGIAGLT
jgi:hypothetical protein